MELSILGMSKTQEASLQRKKIYTMEALLRRAPLHYYDFSKIYSLDRENKETAMMIEKNRPFAITGNVTWFEFARDSQTPMAKLRVIDDLSGHTLFVNMMGMDQYRQRLISELPEHPLNMELSIPEDIPPTACLNGAETLKAYKGICALNDADTITIQMLMALKTHGMDEYSKLTMEQFREVYDEKTIAWIDSFFLGNKYDILTCLRWYARGLKLDLAVRKTLIGTMSLQQLLYGKHVIVGGFISYDTKYKTYSVLNPSVISENIDKYRKYYVQYGQTKGFTPDSYAEYVNEALSMAHDDFMPRDLLAKADLPDFPEAMRMMHHPKNYRESVTAKKRTVFDDLAYFAVKIERNSSGKAEEAPKMPEETMMEQYISSLPFALTEGQRNAINEIRKNMSDGCKVQALVQGDVGTGKTCVAFAAMLKAIENGYQAAMAVPYTTLAWQHARDFGKIAELFGITVVTLTGGMKASEQKSAMEKIRTGEAQAVIGTHSIFGSRIQYHNLGLIIEDEEHKFGVVHREEMDSKAAPWCHKITMSATPIPKSLAETIYGSGCSIISIKDRPAGRTPVKTAVTADEKKCARFILSEVRKKHQAYIVCPSIEDAEDKASKQHIPSIEESEKKYQRWLKPYGVRIAVLTGKMPVKEKTKIMKDFSDGSIDVLMSTTVIEVGMNVPNATVMLVLGADRFGFSTLHQLRGRVGRGQAQGYCIFQTTEGTDKLQFLARTNDGFEIAEKDLELRGPGTLFGERQSGNNYFIQLMLAYPNMFKKIQEYVAPIAKEETGQAIVQNYEKLFYTDED